MMTIDFIIRRYCNSFISLLIIPIYLMFSNVSFIILWYLYVISYDFIFSHNTKAKENIGVNNKMLIRKSKIAIVLIQIDYSDITILAVTLIIFISQQLRYIRCILDKNLTRATSNSNKRSTGFFFGIPGQTPR